MESRDLGRLILEGKLENPISFPWEVHRPGASKDVLVRGEVLHTLPLAQHPTVLLREGSPRWTSSQHPLQFPGGVQGTEVCVLGGGAPWFRSSSTPCLCVFILLWEQRLCKALAAERNV